MVFQMPEYWDMAVDGIQILLCLLILLLLFHNRRKNKYSPLEAAIKDAGKSFNVQVLSQTIKQQIDQAFANIAGTLAAERNKLESLLQFGRSGHDTFGLADSPSASLQTNSRAIASVSDGMSQIDALHQRIQKLAVKGMGARQISEKLKTPLAEVELILSLNTGEHASSR